MENLFWDDMNECGDGGDSNEEGPVTGLLSEAAVSKKVLSSTGKVIGSDDQFIDDIGEPSACTDAVANTGAASVSSTSIPGALKKWEPPPPLIN